MIEIFRIKYFAVIIISFLFGISVNGQIDPTFSQSYANPLYLSPSFTGLTNGSRVAMSYRDQWPGIPNTYKTMSFSFDHFLEEYSSGIGMLLLRDDQGGGIFVRQTAGLLYSYEFEVSRGIFVRPGIQFKYSDQVIDGSKIVYGTDYDDNLEQIINGHSDFTKDTYRKFDAAASGMIYSDFFWFGFTLDHLIKSNVGHTDIETYMPMRSIVFGGYKYKYKEGYKERDEQSITLAVNYFRQQDFQQLDLGVYWYINPMELGVLYRGLPFFEKDGYPNTDAAVMILGINFGPMRFAYSYDLSVSELAGYSNGSNEVSFIYRFNQTYRKKGKRGAIPCSEPGVFGSYGRKYRNSPRKIF